MRRCTNRSDCYFRIPEPTGRTFAEIDILFERRVSARKFASTVVDPFDVEVHENGFNSSEDESVHSTSPSENHSASVSENHSAGLDEKAAMQQTYRE